MAKISFRDKLIEIRFIQAGATTQDVIQITSSSGKKQKKILRNIENNNFLLGYSVINDSTLKIVVNKVGRFVNRPDTVEVAVLISKGGVICQSCRKKFRPFLLCFEKQAWISTTLYND